VVREGVAVEIGDLNIPRCAEESKCLRLAIPRVEADTSVTEPASLCLQLREQLSPDPTAAHRAVDEDAPDFTQLPIDSLDASAAHRAAVKIDDHPHAAGRAQFGRSGTRSFIGVSAGIPGRDVGEECPLKLSRYLRIRGFKGQPQPALVHRR
jgi:hypothetical protein